MQKLEDKTYVKKFNEMFANGEFNYKYVERVKFIPGEIENGPYINSIEVFFSKTINDNHVTHCIAAKELKLQQYKMLAKNKEIDEYWLVINLPTEEHYDIDQFTPQQTYETDYTRVYIVHWEDIKVLKGNL